MPRAGAVWVDVLPNMSNFGRSLNQQIGEPVARASRSAGEDGGEGLMKGMAGKMAAGALAAGVAAGALIAKGIGDSLERQAATGKLKGQLGLSPQEAQKAGAAAGKLYAGAVTESIEDGAAAVRAIMSAGLAPEKATTKPLANLATKAQDLASLFEVDMPQAANAAGQAVKTGLVKNADEAFDVFTRGFQVMGPRADDLMDTFNEYGTIFRSMGLDAKTATGLISQGMKAGARDTDVVADAIKEFTIEAVAGSDKIRGGYKMVGLDADQMFKMIGQGGDSARTAFDMTLDALRNVKDPIDRNAAAVELFGTKAEDLGQSLYSLDPSKAAADLGKVGGAAKQAGDDLRDNAGVSFEQFKRRALMTLGDVATKHVLPPLMRFGSFLNTDVLPHVRTITTWLGDHLVPVVRGTGDAISGTVGWFREWGIWLTPLAVLIGGVTLAMSANAIATSVAMGVMGAYSMAVRGVAAVTRVWAAAQALMNAVMALNPFVLIAIAVVALGAALVIAYQKSETFRNIVQTTWTIIADSALWLWNTVLKPVFDALSLVFRVVATIIVTVLLVAFKAWWTGVKLYFSMVAAVAMWLWKSVFKPVVDGIVWLFGLWWSGVKTYFGLVMAGVRALGAGATWLWKNAFKPVVDGIVSLALWLYNKGIKPAVNLAKTALTLLGDAGTWLWKEALAPAFRGIASVATWLYDKGLKPPINKGKEIAGQLADAFRTAKDTIGEQFGKLSELAKKPIGFIINTVYNRGIVGTWNKVADAFGAPRLDEFHPDGFGRGGVLAGQSSYKQGDDQLVPMRRGEGVAVSEAMRDPYERARLLAVNKAAMAGRSLRPFQGEGFAKGGIFGWVGSAASKTVDLAKSGVSWLKDGIKASAEAGLNKVVQPLIDKISGSASLYRDMVTGIPKRVIKAILGFSGEADKKLEAAGIGGKGYKSALSWARTQHGKPYQWGGNGDPSWDCSGFMSAIESVIRGQKPHRRWATMAFSGAQAPPGWVLNKRSPFMIGITNAGVGHTAGTINGTNVESRGGDGVVVGARARSYRDALFTHRYGFAAKGYADGGKPRPGEVAWVGERGPELVRFGSGSAEVYNHVDSMRMWEGIGARGFAKGTTKAKSIAAAATARVKAATKANKEIPGDLKAFTKSLTGSAADIAKAANELAKDLRAAGGSGKVLAVRVAAVSAKLQVMAKRRDAISGRIAEARQAATDQAKTASDFMGLSNLAGAGSINDVLSGMASRQATVKSFQGQIASLSKRGLSQDLISQLVAMGPDSELAGMFSRASPGQIKQFNAMAKSGAKLSTSYGRTMADAMYDAGKASAKGFLTGLLADEKAIQDAMAKLGADAVKAIRSKKGIDAHSPSRKGAQAGADLGAGLVAGMVAAGPAIESAAARMGAAAVPAGVVPVTSGSSGQAAAGGLDGRPLYLVVEDGTVLRAYVDDRVDGALDDVRRAKRSGKKG
ncbi:replication protein [Streptomyces sp. NTH33]|uniref:phage tail tape measure protein n=1 Tax=Streptomyces sp. NTH33 TaxID=1735453 RepID=UPI000DA92ED0|nr:phage tail tape measure protein [Streptomyces sp. NTH33]PZH18757.1 replication protein [Streptomyces sp. NTH33]